MWAGSFESGQLEFISGYSAIFGVKRRVERMAAKECNILVNSLNNLLPLFWRAFRLVQQLIMVYQLTPPDLCEVALYKEAYKAHVNIFLVHPHTQ